MYKVPRLCCDFRLANPSMRYDLIAGTPTITERPVKLAVALTLKTASSRSNCLRSMDTGKRPRVCWIPATSSADGWLTIAYSVAVRQEEGVTISNPQPKPTIRGICMATKWLAIIDAWKKYCVMYNVMQEQEPSVGGDRDVPTSFKQSKRARNAVGWKSTKRQQHIRPTRFYILGNKIFSSPRSTAGRRAEFRQ